MIRVEDLCFSFRKNNLEQPILKSLNFEIAAGDFVAILGPSGSGKSTLFHILGGLLRPTAGELYVNNQAIYKLSDEDLSKFRNRDLGFVFQQFFLLPRTSVLDNILLPAQLRGHIDQELRDRAEFLAVRVGLKDHLHKKPNELSGGQQQRVAIARALLFEPRFLLADEATGNLDSRNASEIFDLFCQLNSEGATLLWVTHDRELAQKIPQRILLRDGEIEKIEGTSLSRKSGRGSKGPRSEAAANEEAEFAFCANEHSERARTKEMGTFQSRSLGLRQSFPLAVANLSRNKSQSFLTMLGVIFGVSAVLSMMTLGNYSKRRILEGYQGLGANKMLLRGYSNNRQKKLDIQKTRFDDFKMESDILPLKRIFPEIKLLSPVLRSWDASANYGGISTTDKTRILGVNEELFAISNFKLREGISFYPYHVQSGAGVCMIGGDIADKLFNRRSPLGEVLNVSMNNKSGFPCRIIGVLESISSNTEGEKPNSDVYIPYTYMKRLAAGWSSEIHVVAMQVHNGAEPDIVEKKLKGYFASKYGNSGEFHIDKDAKLLAQMKKFLNIFSFLLFGISALALVVGGMGINNMMLISISERFREIGLRKALGASKSFIRNQILTESVLLATTAGVIGLVMGFALYQSLIYFATRLIPKLKYEWIFEPMALSISLISIVLVGILSGLVPALKAENLEVIEALRSE